MPGVSIHGRGRRQADYRAFKLLTTSQGALKLYRQYDRGLPEVQGDKESEGPVFQGKEPLEDELECCLRGCGHHSGDLSRLLPGQCLLNTFPVFSVALLSTS